MKGSDDDIASVTAKKSIVKVSLVQSFVSLKSAILKHYNKFHHFPVFKATPKMTGVLTVTVYDQCLDSPNPATANIRISDIDSIHVTVVDKVRCYDS